MHSFITEGETVLIKCRHLIRTESSYRKDLKSGKVTSHF
jgi:hypothetical protein